MSKGAPLGSFDSNFRPVSTMVSKHLSAVCLLLAALAGCSVEPEIDYKGAGLVDVSGTVKMDGQPLADALVVFESDDRRFSSARTDANGYYKLKFDKNATGIMPGPKTVRISMSGAATEEESNSRRVETVPTKYNKNSELKAEVKPGGDQTFDFDLQSGGEVVQPPKDGVER